MGCNEKYWRSWLISLRGHSIIFEISWRLGEVFEDWRNINGIPTFIKSKGPANYRPGNLISFPEKVKRQLILGTISGHMKGNKIMRSSQHGFAKGKSRLICLINIYNEMTGLVD